VVTTIGKRRPTFYSGVVVFVCPCDSVSAERIDIINNKRFIIIRIESSDSNKRSQMSRWLQNVGQFLEQLDDQAEKVADERLQQEDRKDIASILAARGLEQDDDDDDDDDLEEEVDDLKEEEEDDENAKEEEIALQGNQEEKDPVKTELEEDFDPNAWPEQSLLDLVNDKAEQQVHSVSDLQQTQEASNTNEIFQETTEHDIQTTTTLPNDETPLKQPSVEHSESVHVPVDGEVQSETQQSSQFNMTPFRVAGGALFSNIKSHLKVIEPSSQPDGPSASRESQKEVKTLKRHVVKLNSQLEQAETEIQAQREELERAAERIEKDRTRYQQEKESEKKRHADEVQLLKMKHEQALEDAKSRSNTQLDEARRQFHELEQRRMQEGGDMNKELSDAVQREQEFMQKIALLEDEKTTFLSQIGTLQAQQEALGSRLESLTQTADNAMAREREAEDRLDQALSLHAQQISQRNNREAELEKTVADLGAALVEAKSPVNARWAKEQAMDTSGFQHDLSNEIEALEAQLVLEKQKCDMLQREVRSLTRERADEISISATRQVEYDRRLQEMGNEIISLKRDLDEAKRLDSGKSLSLSDTSESKTLSEDLFRQRELVTSCKSEIATLKSRLKTAISRAEKAEDTLERAHTSSDGADDIEVGKKVRLRGRSRRTPASGFQTSMSSALNLSGAQGDGSKRLSKSLDVVDTMLSQSGTVLRQNPIARLMFSKCTMHRRES
jgi:outer membrane murein-binding lipoprotein Lpp